MRYNRLSYLAMAIIWFFGAFTSSLGPGQLQGLKLLAHAGLHDGIAHLVLWGGIFVDALMCVYTVFIMLGFLSPKYYWAVNLGFIAVLTVLATIVAPQLWLDPFGQIVKNFGLLALCAAQLQLFSKR